MYLNICLIISGIITFLHIFKLLSYLQTLLLANSLSCIIHFARHLMLARKFGLFCDISKAFDRVWHAGLLHKLNSVEISGDLLKWFSSYLDGRKQRVVLQRVESKRNYIKAGVPQGSSLGPLFFLNFH